MKNGVMIFSLLALVSCGKDGRDGAKGLDGSSTFGINGTSTGIDFEDLAPGLVCANGGIAIFTFQDENSDGALQNGESVLKVKSLCNGSNGSDGAPGTSATLTLASFEASATCPNGGVSISSSTAPAVEVCNGENGLNGEQGLPGIQGIPGIAGADGADGADGTMVKPVKFCLKDESAFPEYGLLIGDELFAVYWGVTPGSPKKEQAFLTKLVPGKYMSTGGENCLFAVD